MRGTHFPNDVPIAGIRDEGYAIGITTIESFRRIRQTLYRAASVVFDVALGASDSSGLSVHGQAAMRVLQQSAHRQTDLALRELAGAIVRRDFDLLRRLLARYSIELNESEAQLESMARRHIQWCRRGKLECTVYGSVRAMDSSRVESYVSAAAKGLSIYTDVIPRVENTGGVLAKFEFDDLVHPVRYRLLAWRSDTCKPQIEARYYSESVSMTSVMEEVFSISTTRRSMRKAIT